MDELVKAVKDHAQANYDKGWDVVVVCWTDPEIAEEIKGCRSAKGAIRKMGQFVGVWNDRKRDIEGTAW